MQATTWLRIAAGLTLFQAAGHTFGAVFAGPTQGPAEVTLRDSMRAFRVTAMGMERSYWDFYFGSGWAITALAVSLAAVMWLLAPIARQTPALARPVILALTAGYAAVTIISALYFVTAPIVVSAAITLSLLAAALPASLAPGRRGDAKTFGRKGERMREPSHKESSWRVSSKR